MNNIEDLLFFSGKDNYLRVSKGLVRTLGVECAFLFAELVDEFLYYYENKYNSLNENDYWFYSTADNIKERTGWSADKQDRILKELETHGLIIKKVMGIPAKRHFKLCFEKARKLVVDYHETTFRKKRKLDTVESGNLSSEITETNIRNSNEGTLTMNFNSKEKTNKKEIPVSANFTHTQNYEDIIENFMQEKYPHLPEITKDSLRRFVGCMILEQQKRNKKELTRNEVIEIFAQIIKTLYPEIPTISILENVEPTCKENLQVESVAGHKNYIHNTQKKSGRDIYTIEFEEFWAKYCEIAKAKNYTAGDKKAANKCYLKALQKRGHQDIMRVLTIYQEFILLAFENNKHASSWLNAIDWPDFENQIKQYETDIVNLKNKAKQKEQNTAGQKLIQKPVYEVSEEDKKKQEQELKEYANVKTEKPQFMEHFKSVLKNYYGSSHFSWIQSLKMKSINENEVVFMLQCQVYVDIIQRNNAKFEQIFNREFQGFYKEFAGKIKFIAWKI